MHLRAKKCNKIKMINSGNRSSAKRRKKKMKISFVANSYKMYVFANDSRYDRGRRVLKNTEIREKKKYSEL